MKHILFIAGTLLLAAPAPASGIDGGTPGKTVTPLTYVLAYGGDVVGNPEMMRELRGAPPDLLHVGHALPLNSIWGPTADYSGWKPKLVPAEEILARRGELRAFVSEVRAAGVRAVICYTNPSILGGDHETRGGFWAFYDHWDDYAALGLGPKPETPPESWMQRGRRTFDPWTPEPDYPFWRYEPCVNEPAWRAYQQVVVRLAAECGYDGVFVDDCIQECRHPACQKLFPDFLQGRYAADELAALFGGGFAMGAPAGRDLRAAETCLFWQDSIAGHLNAIKDAARGINPDFFAVPNWGAVSRVRGAVGRARSGKDSRVWLRGGGAWQMYEEAHPQGHLGPDDVFGYLLQYKYGLSLGVRPVIISYGNGRRYTELGHAEAAAGGGGAFVQCGAAFPEIRLKWRSFYGAHPELFSGLEAFAPVGLVLSYDEIRFGNENHLREALAVSRALFRRHVPFAVLSKEDLAPETLAGRGVVILPDVRHLSDGQLAALAGRALLVSGKSGAFDLSMRERAANPLAAIAAPETPAAGVPVRVASMAELVDRREFEIVDALDELDEKAFLEKVGKIAALPRAAGEDRLCGLLNALAGRELSIASDATVQTMAYRRLEGDRGTVTVHAVRYAAAVRGGEESEVGAAPLRVTLPPPEGWRVEKARVLAPGAEPAVLPFTESGAGVSCEIPAFEFYALLELALRRDGG